MPPLEPSQAASLASSLRWAAGTLAASGGGAVAGWRALLVLRADIELKRPLPLPAPLAVQGDDSLIVPFQDKRLTPQRRSARAPQHHGSVAAARRVRARALARLLCTAPTPPSPLPVGRLTPLGLHSRVPSIPPGKCPRGRVRVRVRPCRPRVADTLLFLPRPRVHELLALLENRSGAGRRLDHLHYLCDWLPRMRFLIPPTVDDGMAPADAATGGDAGPPRTAAGGAAAGRIVYDSNSAKEWNPLYRMVGRPEAAQRRSAPTAPACRLRDGCNPVCGAPPSVGQLAGVGAAAPREAAAASTRAAEPPLTSRTERAEVPRADRPFCDCNRSPGGSVCRELCEEVSHH
eukprot:6138328-Prymnesium_polylepis.1